MGDPIISLSAYLVREACDLDDGEPVVMAIGAEAVRKMALAAKAERDQLKAEVERLTKVIDIIKSEVGRLAGGKQEEYERAEKAEAQYETMRAMRDQLIADLHQAQADNARLRELIRAHVNSPDEDQHWGALIAAVDDLTDRVRAALNRDPK